MNKLSAERRAAVIHALCEGNSIRATCRLTGTAKGTVLRLLLDMGEASEAFHDANVRDVAATQVQCDEVWSFVAMKERTAMQHGYVSQVGDAWTWVALDPDSKLAISFYVGRRGAREATLFLGDLKHRLAGRVQLSTDAFRVYRPAVARVFGEAVDFGQVQKVYSRPATEGPARYSPPVVISCDKLRICGDPEYELVSTSLVERQNLTLRMSSRRFTRLTNAFSKSMMHHCAAVALNFVFYNWCKPHGTLTKERQGVHTTPAMAAGLTDRVWTIADLLNAFKGRRAA
jgi:IS1 family transposase